MDGMDVMDAMDVMDVMKVCNALPMSELGIHFAQLDLSKHTPSLCTLHAAQSFETFTVSSVLLQGDFDEVSNHARCCDIWVECFCFALLRTPSVILSANSLPLKLKLSVVIVPC